jgi:chemotaxis signal transduction protein
MTRHVLPVQIDRVWLGLDALEVQEILELSAWLPIPGARPAIPGVMPWRGQALAVLDMAAVSADISPLTPDTSRTRVVVARAGLHTIAAPVHAVREVCDIPDGAVEKPADPSPGYLVGEAVLAGDRLPLLDLPALLRLVGAT